MYRKCQTCAGKGSIWGTPRLLNDDFKGPVAHPDKLQPPNNVSFDSNSDYGLSVTCWRCVGKGLVRDNHIDQGDA